MTVTHRGTQHFTVGQIQATGGAVALVIQEPNVSGAVLVGGAAARWQRGEGLSLADRLCLALGHRRGHEIWTADTAWGTDERIEQIR